MEVCTFKWAFYYSNPLPLHLFFSGFGSVSVIIKTKEQNPVSGCLLNGSGCCVIVYLLCPHPTAPDLCFFTPSISPLPRRQMRRLRFTGLGSLLFCSGSGLLPFSKVEEELRPVGVPLCETLVNLCDMDPPAGAVPSRAEMVDPATPGFTLGPLAPETLGVPGPTFQLISPLLASPTEEIALLGVSLCCFSMVTL